MHPAERQGLGPPSRVTAALSKGTNLFLSEDAVLFLLRCCFCFFFLRCCFCFCCCLFLGEVCFYFYTCSNYKPSALESTRHLEVAFELWTEVSSHKQQYAPSHNQRSKHSAQKSLG